MPSDLPMLDALTNYPEEFLNDLKEAIDNNCSCTYGQFSGKPVRFWCGAHRILADEKILNHLLYVRHERARYRAEEFDPYQWRSQTDTLGSDIIAGAD